MFSARTLSATLLVATLLLPAESSFAAARVRVPRSSSSSSTSSRRSSSSSSSPVYDRSVRVLYNGSDFYVPQITAGSPAYVAGVRAGDIITVVDGVEVTQSKFSADELGQKLSNVPAGKKLKVEIFRSSGRTTVTIVGPSGSSSSSAASVGLTDLSVTAKDGVCTVLIHDFGDRFSAAAKASITSKIAACPKGWIVDLRYSPGGSLDAVTAFTSLFLKSGIEIAIFDDSTLMTPLSDTIFHVGPGSRDPKNPVKVSKSIQTAKGEQVVRDATKLVVLTPDYPAGSSMLFAYSVARNRAAFIVGDHTTFAATGLRAFSPGGMLYIRYGVELRLLNPQMMYDQTLMTAVLTSKDGDDAPMKKALTLLK